ncbi:MAG: TOBE domain-containing protein [Acetobacteraceae bacterium]
MAGRRVLYREPPNRFAAEFLGRANLLPVQIEPGAPGGTTMRVRHGAVSLLAMTPRTPLAGPDCLLCVRPHALALAPAPGLANSLPATVQTVQWQGDLHSLELDIAGTTMRMVCMPLREPPLPGTAVHIHFAADDASLIPADAPGANA